MMMKVSVFFGLKAAAGLAAAGVAGVPRAALPPCASTLNSLLTSSDPGIGCLAPEPLNSLFSLAAKNLSLATVRGGIDGWLTGMCQVGFCSDPTLEIISGNITAGCNGADALIGSTNVIPTNFTAELKLYYPAFRDMMCLTNTVGLNTNFCLTEQLTQSSVDSFNAGATDPLAIIIELVSKSFNLDCNECTKAAAQIANKVPGFPFGTDALTSTCGANFTATLNNTPVNITQTAVDTEFKSPNGVGALAPTTTLILFTVAVFFTLL